MQYRLYSIKITVQYHICKEEQMSPHVVVTVVFLPLDVSRGPDILTLLRLQMYFDLKQ